jgi:uncharacterized protein involved in exopolysaccharide biosynthesis
MNLFQFLRILWARRYLTLMTTVCTFIGAIIAILIIPPRYEGVSRVLLNILKPDPITGEVVSTQSARTYITTQMELIRDFGVAGKAVDRLNWAANPDIVSRYQSGNNSDVDIRRWLSQQIIASTTVKVVPGTNILEIAYRSSNPSDAKAMANELRESYIEATLDTRRREASGAADWYTAQAEKERALLNSAEAAKAAFEKEHGVVMQGATDVDTARLGALAAQAGAPAVTFAPAAATVAPSSAQLTQLDATIAEAAKHLGPNHPQMVQLRAQRASLAQVVAQELAAQRAAQGAAASAAAASAQAMKREFDTQAHKVIANREVIARLNQLQEEVNVRREQYNKSMARIAELRQQASIADSGISTLGEAVTPREPSFPNKPLILGGAISLGFGMGILLSLLVELLGRRVRGVEDLQDSVDAPLLAVIGGGTPEKNFELPKGLSLGKRGAPGRGKLVRA